MPACILKRQNAKRWESRTIASIISALLAFRERGARVPRSA